MNGGMRSRRRGLNVLIWAAPFSAAAMLVPLALRADEPAGASPSATQVAALNRPAPADGSADANAADKAVAVATGLIKQLGDDRFVVREEASARLSQMGIEIQPALEAAAHAPDLEVRIRVRRILDTVLKADLERRLMAFADDVNDTKHLTLPGWSRYRQLIGSNGPARQVFVEMQRAEPNLFRAVEDGPNPTASALENAVVDSILRAQNRSRIVGGNMLSLGSVSAMIFVGSDSQVTIPENIAQQLAYLLNQPSIRQAATGGNQSTVVRKIIGVWITRDASANVLVQNLSIAMQLELKEGVQAAANALKQGNQPGYVKQMALTMIGRMGDKTNLPVVEALLSDNEICGQINMNNQLFQTQVRDVALAIAIHLEGQNPKDFGYDRLDLTNAGLYYNPGLFGFKNAADRDAATKKWADWTAKHKSKTDGKTDASTTPKKS